MIRFPRKYSGCSREAENEAAPLGKLPLPDPPQLYLPKQRDLHRFSSLPVNEADVLQLATLPPLHRDPFDRLLICQAIEHGLTLVTVDDQIRAYPVPVLSAA